MESRSLFEIDIIPMSAKSGYPRAPYAAPFKRYCQTLDLVDDPKLIEEYKHWHSADHNWPEIPAGIKEVGILEMEIYIFGSRLFMIVETPADFDWDTAFAKLSKLPKQAEWEEFVSKYQLVKPGCTSSEKWQLMDRIFSLPK
jgi:L-rhamnose mutarotase